MEQNVDAIFPSVNEKWHKHAEKRFASPFTGHNFDRIDVDPMMLSHAALISGFTIVGARKPTISIVGGIAPIHTSGALLPQCSCNRIIDTLRLLFSFDVADGQGEVAAQ